MNTLFSRPALKLLGISAVALAASALLTATPPSYAQTPPQTPSLHRMPLSPEQMAAHAQKRLDKMERSLNLQPGQQSAWASYKSSALADMNDRAAKIQQRREQMQRDQANGTATMPAPQRMEKRAKRMREHADALSSKAQQVQSLYATLTPEQRTIFDLQMQGRRHALGSKLRRLG